MSLSRAFTTKRSRTSPELNGDVTVKRSFTMKKGSVSTIRDKISGPVELISTTNMLSYNAPNIVRGRSSTSSSAGSSSASSNSDGSPSSLNTAFTSPDTSSMESSPTACSPEPNHLSCYFNSPGTSPISDEDAPQIPRRMPSHTKKSTEYLARKRSLSRASPKNNSISSAASSPGSMVSSRSSIGTPSPPLEPHPFGRELAQVSELAEEFRSPIILDGSLEVQEKLAIIDEEEQELISKGFYKFAADDYMSELQGLYITAFEETPLAPRTELWI